MVIICSKDGNPFDLIGNATIAPAHPPRSPVTAPPSGNLVFGTPSSGRVPAKQAHGPSAAIESSSGKSKTHMKRVVWICISGVLVFIIFALGLAIFIPRCSRKERVERTSKQHLIGAYGRERQNPRDNGAFVQPPRQTEKGKKTYSSGLSSLHLFSDI